MMIASLTHVLSPMAKQELSLRSAEISRDITARLLTEGTFVHPVPGITFYVREIPPSGELFDVYLSDSRSGTARINYLARRALIVKEDSGPVLLMFDGASHTYDLMNGKLSVTTFDSFAYELGDFLPPASSSSQSVGATTSYELLTTPLTVMAATKRDRATLRKAFHERNSKASLAIASALIGFSCLIAGGFSRFGLVRQIALAFGLLIVVKAVDSVGISAVRRDASHWPMLYMSLLAGLLISATLLAYAAHPNMWRKKLQKRAGGPQ